MSGEWWVCPRSCNASRFILGEIYWSLRSSWYFCPSCGLHQLIFGEDECNFSTCPKTQSRWSNFLPISRHNSPPSVPRFPTPHHQPGVFTVCATPVKIPTERFLCYISFGSKQNRDTNPACLRKTTKKVSHGKRYREWDSNQSPQNNSGKLHKPVRHPPYFNFRLKEIGKTLKWLLME